MLAGAIGTAFMDSVWYLRYRRGGGTSGPLQWEFTDIDSWDQVSAPGRLGKLLAEAFLQKPLPAEAAGSTNNIVHWGYGVGWGAAYGLLAGYLRRADVILGPPFGTTVWLSGYVILPLAGLYKPIWRYDFKTLLKDWSAHLAYGTSTAAAFAMMTGRPGSRQKAHRRGSPGMVGVRPPWRGYSVTGP
jgi:hypothetical protein